MFKSNVKSEVHLLNFSKGTCDKCHGGGHDQSSCCESSDLRSCPVWAGHCSSDDQCDGGLDKNMYCSVTSILVIPVDLRCGTKNCKNVYSEALADSNCCSPYCPAGRTFRNFRIYKYVHQ